MTSVHNNHLSASKAMQRSSSTENREQLLPCSLDNTPLPPSPPVSASPPATIPTPDPAVEYGDDDIDDVLFEDPQPPSDRSSSRSRAVSNLHHQDEKQKMRRTERMKRKRTVSLPIQISLYNRPCTESNSNYNHLNPTHMFAVLEQIQIGIHKQWYQSPPIMPTAIKIKHDSLGYAVPARKNSAKDSERVVMSTQEHTYDIIDTAQKEVFDESKENGNSSSVSAQPTQPEESDGTSTQVTKPPGTTASTTCAGASVKGIQPYATFDIMTQQIVPTDDDDSTYDEVRQPQVTIIKVECDGTGDSNSVHEPAKVEPMYAEVTEHGTIVTTHHSFTIADDELIEPYAMVNISYKQKMSNEHKLASDSVTTCTPINTGLSKMELDESNMCNKVTALTA